MNFLKKEISDLLSHYFEMEWSNAEILKEALNEQSPLYPYLQPNYEDSFTNLMKCLLDGYETDETEALRNIGLMGHPYLLEEETDYYTTFAIYHLKDGDFDGSIWIPYPSKPDYRANLSFTYQGDSYPRGNSRIAEIDSAPEWFQTLFRQCEAYVNNRNHDTLLVIHQEFELLYANLKKEALSSPSVLTHSLYYEITAYGFKVVPCLLTHLQKEEDKLLCHLLDSIVDFEFRFESHGEDEKLTEYNQAKESFSSWRTYLLDWGKQMEWME